MANYPVPYQCNWSGAGQPIYQQYPQNVPQTASGTAHDGLGIIWVDGEVGAKAYQIPHDWPAGKPIALWDTNDTVIYLKSMNPMGMPNPLQKAHYRLENVNSGEKNQGYSGDAGPNMSEFIRKEDMERMKQELLDAINSVSTSGSNRRSAREDT